eukprot:TRINITY_DN769_c0_g1_i1.p1 TRINITY_DN769_c0_g1~~TRINITY_DN769_c0_g1_i1.p1  ORF type:complete len:556 (-),score=141.80 TRINITY_DN769_c0_g1_i1:107-1774(-)
MFKVPLFTLLLCVLGCVNTKSYNNDLTYIASTVEYTPLSVLVGPNVTKEIANDFMQLNIDNMEKAIQFVKKSNAQVIVWPEYGLTSNPFTTRASIFPYIEYIPDPTEGIYIPCNNTDFDDRKVIQRISCLAIQYDILIAVDMGSYVPCMPEEDDNCPSDGRYQYNTNVAFETNGQIVGRYHKNHLYFESFFDTPNVLDISYFKSSSINDVTFGLMVCFDLLFGLPSANYTQQLGVNNILYPTSWHNLVPLSQASEMQQSWSRFNKANLIASQNGERAFNSSGSGIYSAGDALIAEYNNAENQRNKIIISQIPKNPSHSSKFLEMGNLFSKVIDFPTNQDSSVDLKNEQPTHKITHVKSYIEHAFDYYHSLSESERILRVPVTEKHFETDPGFQSNFTLVAGEFDTLQCNFSISVSEESRTQRYVAVVMNVPNIDGFVPAPVKYCGIFFCENRVIDPFRYNPPCQLGEIYSVDNLSIAGEATFNSISVNGNFLEQYSVLPNGLYKHGQKLPQTSETTFTSFQQDNETYFQFSYENKDNEVSHNGYLNFGISQVPSN